MKKHFSYSILLLALGFAFAMGGCQQPSDISQHQSTLPLNSASTPANPALTFTDQTNTGTNKNPVLVDVLEVCDSSASHRTTLYTASSSSEAVTNPCWAPGGGSICFLDGTGTFGLALKACDVSVNSNGVAVASNFRSIYAPSISDSVRLYDPRWSQNSSTAQIAFIRLHYNYTQKGLFELCVVSTSGGTVTVLSSIQDLVGNTVEKNFRYPDWSPDDSKIALSRQDTIVTGTSVHCTIMLLDASTGAALDSITPPFVSGGQANTIRWSHTGTNELAFTVMNTGIYYCAPSTGSTPTTNGVNTAFDCWSPTNSTLLIGGGSSALRKLTPFTTTTSTIASSFTDIGPIDWKH